MGRKQSTLFDDLSIERIHIRGEQPRKLAVLRAFDALTEQRRI